MNHYYENVIYGLRIGDRVRNNSPISKWYGQVGTIVDIGYSFVVKYKDDDVMGIHPAKILTIVPEHFDEELFTL